MTTTMHPTKQPSRTELRALRTVRSLFVALLTIGAVVLSLGAALPTRADIAITILYVTAFLLLSRMLMGIDLSTSQRSGFVAVIRSRRRVSVAAAALEVAGGVCGMVVGVFVIVVAHEASTPVLLSGGSGIGAVLAATGVARIVRAGYAVQRPFRATGQR